jgi:hypothetical protein
MNFLVETLICVILGVYGHKLLAKRGISGKHITALVMMATLALFVYLPLMFSDVENGDEPSIWKDQDGNSPTNEEVYDFTQVALRTYISLLIAFFGSIGILIS